MLEGVVRFPPEFAARYRAKGYWEDRSLAEAFAEVFAKYGERVAIIDRGESITYAQLNERSECESVPGLTMGTGKKRMRKSIDFEVTSVLDKIAEKGAINYEVRKAIY